MSYFGTDPGDLTPREMYGREELPYDATELPGTQYEQQDDDDADDTLRDERDTLHMRPDE